MKLDVKSRTIGKKSLTKQIRRDGNIPAIVYSKGQAGKEIVVDGREFKKITDSIESGTLSSKVFTMALDGKEFQAIVKGIEYHPVSYDILHLDFEQLHKDHRISLKIPIRCVGVADCIGIKKGGALRQVTRSLKVSCLPKDIPSHFEVDVKNLVVGQGKKLSEMKIPEGVHPLGNLKVMAAIIARK